MNQYFEQEPGEMEEFLDFIEEDVENVRRAVETCREKDLDVEFRIHPKSETAEQSAENTGVELEQVVKTLVFIAEEPVAVLCPGDSRINEEKLEDLTGSSVRMANPGEVEEATGYVVGGVSPFDLDIPVYMEESILEREEVKPAAGSRVVGVTVDPGELKRAVGAKTANLTV